MAFSVVRDPGPVGAQVAIELSERSQQLPLLGSGLFELEVLLQVLDNLEGPEEVAVPEEPLEPLELTSRLARQIAAPRPSPALWPSGP